MNEKANDPENTPDEKQPGPKKSGSPRLMILLILLLLMGGLLAYERLYMVPQAKQKIEEVFALMKEKTSDGHGIPKDRVHEVAGIQPKMIELKGDSIELETYEFPRIFSFLPFVKGESFQVIYTDKALSQVLRGKEFTLQASSEQVTTVPEEERHERPALGGGG